MENEKTVTEEPSAKVAKTEPEMRSVCFSIPKELNKLSSLELIRIIDKVFDHFLPILSDIYDARNKVIETKDQKAILDEIGKIHDKIADLCGGVGDMEDETGLEIYLEAHGQC